MRAASAAAPDNGPRPLVVCVAGNPNVGKTSLYNALTGAAAETANYAGVSVAAASVCTQWGERRVEVVDGDVRQVLRDLLCGERQIIGRSGSLKRERIALPLGRAQARPRVEGVGPNGDRPLACGSTSAGGGIKGHLISVAADGGHRL